MNKTFFHTNLLTNKEHYPLYTRYITMSLLKKAAFYAVIIFLICIIFNANAASYNQQEAATGLKSVLTQTTEKAISELATPGGFSNNPSVKINLPNQLNTASKLLKRAGLGGQLTQLEKGMNTAAEAAIPEAQTMLLNSIKQMTFKDAKAIITDGDTAATSYLEKTNRTQLFNKFLPKVKTITDSNALATDYNSLIQKASFFGVANDHMTIENYVTNKALDGLFKTMAEQESYLRNHPTEAASSIAKKLFEAIK